MIRCKKCESIFEPANAENKEPWKCPDCGGENPNLRHLFRSVAGVYLLWTLGTVAFAAHGIVEQGFSADVLVPGVQAVLLLIAAICIYKSASPWKSLIAKTLIWITFGCLITTGVIVPLLANRIYPALAGIYALVFMYLVWLHVVAWKLTAQSDA